MEMANVRIDAKEVNSLADLQRLKEEISAAKGSNATVDLSQVKKMSMLLMQLLLAAKESFKSEGCTLSFTQSSKGLLDTLSAAGLGELKEEFAMDTAT
jgi:anti-anti-sigma regulatory factor